MKRLAYFVMVLTAFVTLRAERIIGEGWYDTSVLSNGVYITTTESVSGGSENIGEPFPIGAPSSKSSSRVCSAPLLVNVKLGEYFCYLVEC